MKLPSQILMPFLSFTGTAEEAMNFYVRALPGAVIESLERYGEGTPPGDEGTVLTGALIFKGQRILFLDMPKAYPAPAFSWATSLFINCADEPEFDAIFSKLSENGSVMMGPEPVMHMRKCTWVTDKFGVTWQLVWE